VTTATGLPTLGADIDWPDAAAALAVEESMPPGSGRLTELARWVAGAQGSADPVAPRHPRALVLGGVQSPAASGAAARLGVALTVLTPPDDVLAAAAEGVRLADAAADEGCDLLVLAGGADPTDVAAAVVCLISGAEPVSLLPRGAAAVDTARWIGRAVLLRDRLRSITRLREDPDDLLLELGDPALALAATLLMRSAARRTLVLIDGPLVAAAAALCYDVQARAGQWWRPADADPDPVHRRAVDDLALTPVLDLGLARRDGLAGLLAVGVVQAAAAIVKDNSP